MNQNLINKVMKILTTKWISAPLYAAVELDIADILAGHAATCNDIAAKTGVDSDKLYRLLRALAGAGFFREGEDGRFENTPLSECLLDKNLRPMARMFSAPWHNHAWDMLLPSLSSKTPAFEIAHKKSAFRWLADNPDAAAAFNQANAMKIRGIAAEVAKKYDFSPYRRIADIGGGNGELLTEILKQFREASGTVADLPHVIDSASKNIKQQGLQDRCSVAPIDFMNAIPGGYDLYILCNVIHDWDDEYAANILTNCRSAIEPQSLLLVIEMPIPEGNGFSTAKLMDLEVMIMGDGRERTRNEYYTLLTQAGFSLRKEIPCGDYSVFEYSINLS